MEKETYRINGSDHGVSGVAMDVQLPVMLDGIPLYNADKTSNFPRNENERKILDQIIGPWQSKAALTRREVTPEGGFVVKTHEEEREQAMLDYNRAVIRDPIRAAANVAEGGAEQSTFKYMSDIGTQIGNIMPGFGGSMLDFSPNQLLESLANVTKKSFPNDPKRFFGDVAVIGSDLFLAGLSMGNVKFADKKNFNIPLFTNESMRMGLRGALERNPVKSTVAVNVLARGASDTTYNLLNDAYRWLGDISPEEGNDSDVENIFNMRSELLWSGGAMGIAKLFPYIKPFIGKHFLGINKEAERLATLGRIHNIPMSAFNVTNSQLVKSLPPVVGLFPIVATNARIAQNAQSAAAYNSMINALEELSPIRLFEDAGLMIDAGFRKTVGDFGTMKGTLYANVSKMADGLNQEAFIPVKKIKILAASLRSNKEKATIHISGRGVGDAVGKPTTLAEITRDIRAGANIEDALLQLDGIKADHVNAEQLKGLIESINATQRNLPALKLDPASDEANLLKTFHVEAIRALNDTKHWLPLKNKEQEALAREWKDAYTVANDFIFQNADTIGGRTAMVLKQTDPNINIPGAVQRPGYLFADQMAKIFFDDQTVRSPMALKEMRLAFGDTPFKASSSAYFNDIIQQNTEFVSGKIRVLDDERGVFSYVKSKITGKDPDRKMQTIDFNIPVVNWENLSKQFGVGDINRRNGILEMFKAGSPSKKNETAYANEQLKKLTEIMELGKLVQQPNYGLVSQFVKRRGILGGLGSITNLLTGGAILSNPIASAAMMLIARGGMNSLSDPRFLDDSVKALDPMLSDVARKAALVTMGRGFFDPERAVNEGYDINNVYDIIELIATSDMENSDTYNERAETEYQEQSAVPEDIRGERKFEPNAESAINMPSPRFAPTDFGALEDLMAEQEVSSAVNSPYNPVPLNDAQRVAMSSGNLDEAIALGRRT